MSLLAVTLLAAGPGCDQGTTAFLTGDAGNTTGGQATVFGSNNGIVNSDEEQGRGATVTVRFANITPDAAVDVQFFALQKRDALLPDELFVEENAITRDIGLAGTGILPPAVTDSIEVPCGSDLIIGTQGGIFSDAQTGDVLGLGDSRWLEEIPLGLCGSIVTLEFAPAGDGYASRVLIGR
jgi:hypothetical protein